MADISVIGAGIAGLTAALEIARADHKVTLLEARNRLGGRIYTTFAKDKKTPLEMGASFFEGLKQNPFYQRYFSENKQDLLKPYAQRLDGSLTIMHSALNKAPQAQIHAYYHQGYQALKNSIYASGKTCQQYLDGLSFKRCSPIEAYWIKKFAAHHLQHFNTGLSLRGFPGFSIANDTDLLETWNDEDADFCFVTNGYYQIITMLKQECQSAGVDIYLNSPVLQIKHGKNQHIKIITPKKTFIAEKAIVTIPMGVLKKQAKTLFSPLLSDEKMHAIETIGVHQGIRITLEFQGQPFWAPKQSPYIFLDIPSKPYLIEFRNSFALHGKAILQTDKYTHVAQTYFQQFPYQQRIAEKKIIKHIMTDIRNAYSYQSIANPIQYHIYNWSADPYALGAYPYRTIGMTEKVQQALEQPEGNLYFAGADFSRHGFSVHNGYANGKKTAIALIKALTKVNLN